jgi:hypothetical protein
MKLLLFVFLIFLFSCHAPNATKVMIVTAPETTATIKVIKPISVEPVLDSTTLQITEFVYNPKHRSIYGIKLTNLDTLNSVHIQKVILGNVVKTYDPNCSMSINPRNAAFREDPTFAPCHLEPLHDATFAIISEDKQPKLEVYYLVNGIQKYTYSSKTTLIECVIEMMPGKVTLEVIGGPKQDCLWVVGWGN